MKPRLLFTSIATRTFIAPFAIAISFSLSGGLRAATYTWDGGPTTTATDLGTAANWTDDILPSVATPDTAEWNGTVPGPLALIYSNTSFAGSPGNSGLNLHLTSDQTADLNIDSGANPGSMRIGDLTIDAGAGAFSLGDTVDAFNLTLGGGPSTHVWMNDSSLPATIESDIVWGLGGGGAHTLAIGGSGNWNFNNPAGQGNGVLSIVKTGTGTANFNGANTYTGTTVIAAGTLNYHGSLGLTGTAAGAMTLGAVGGDNAVLNLSTSSSLKFNNTNLNIGAGILDSSGQGFVNQSGGTVSGINQLQIGAGASGSSYGHYQLSGGTLGMAELDLGGFNGASSGVMNLSAGTVNVSAWIVPSRGNSGIGILNMTGGTLNFTGPAGQFSANWGDGAGSLTVINVANSELIAAPANVDLMRTGVDGKLGVINLLEDGLMQVNSIAPASATGTSLVNFSGGTLKANAPTSNFLSSNLTESVVYAAGGTIDNNGIAISIPHRLQAPAGEGVTEVEVIDGGSGYLGAPVVSFSGGGGVGATGYAVLSGDSIASIVVTNPGTNYTSEPIVTLTGGGGFGAATGTVTTAPNVSGGMTFVGAGTTSLGGENTYTGPTLVSAGTLALTGSGTFDPSSTVTLNGPNAKLLHIGGIPLSSPVNLTQGTIDGTGIFEAVTVANSPNNSLHAGDGGNGLLTIDRLEFEGAATLHTLVTGGFVDRTFQTNQLITHAAGKVSVNATNTSGAWQAGDYVILTYHDSFTGSPADFEVGSIPGLSTSQTASIVDIGGGIALRIVGDSLTWTGNQSGNWSTTAVGGAFNWNYPSSGQKSEFTNSATVLFDDSAQGFEVNLTSDVAPAATVFDNFDNPYTLSSTGNFGITAGSLVKNGGESLTLLTTNSYSGATTVNQGTLQLGNGAIDGSIASSSTLTANGSANVIFNFAGDHTYSNPIQGGDQATFTKTGNGALTLAGDNSFTSAFLLDAGTLNLNSPTALGSGPGALTIAGGRIDNTSGAAIVSTTQKPQIWNADFTFTGSNDLSLGTAPVSLGGSGSTRAVTVSAGTLSTGAINSPAYDLVKAGAGTLQSNGVSVIHGRIKVQAGVFGTSEDLYADGLTGPGTFTNKNANPKWTFWTINDDLTTETLIQNGSGSASLGLVKRGPATWTLTNPANNATANLVVDHGKLVLNNGSYGVLLDGGAIPTFQSAIGSTAGGNGVLEINGASVNYHNASNADALPYRGSLAVGNNATGAGAVHLSAGTLEVYRQLSLGNVGGAFGGYSQSGGSATVGGFLAIGLGNSSGVFNQSGGTFTMTGAPVTNGAGSGSFGVMDLSGSAVFNQNPAGDQGIWVGESGSGTLNLSGNAELNFATNNNGLQLARNGSGTGTVNLLGGNLVTPKIAKGAGNGTLNFNGGTVTANVTSTTFLTGLTNAFVHEGGGTINNGGQRIDIGQALLAPSGNGVSATGLTVSGDGFVETPVVQITGDGVGASAVASINEAGQLTGITITNPGSGYLTPPTLTLIGGGIGNTGVIEGTATLVPQNSGGMTFVGTGITTLTAANTYLGNTTVGSNSVLSLSPTGSLLFAPQANGVSNKVTGTGTAAFYGTFQIDLNGAAIADGNRWTLVDATQTSYDSLTFTIPGFTRNANVWTKVDGGNTWTFSQATGELTLQSSGISGYAAWAAAHAGGGTADGDFDHDGVSNGVEYFMGASGSSFTATPGLVNGKITWPKDPAYSGTYSVQTSANLVDWTDAPSAEVGNTVEYTPAANPGKIFVRLRVTPQ